MQRLSFNKDEIVARALAANINLRTDVAGQIGISLDETTNRAKNYIAYLMYY